MSQLSIINEIASSKAAEIRNYFDTDFEKELFDAIIENLADSKNRLRLNNFAYAARELIRFYLNHRSDDDIIKTCSWFDPRKNCGKTTWTDKMQYVIHRKLSPDYLYENLSINIDDIIRSLKEDIDELSKYTHISDTFMQNSLNNSIAIKLFDSLWNFFRLIETTKNKLCEYFEAKIHDVVNDTFVFEYFDDIDTLSTHSAIDEAHVESIDLTSFDDKELRFNVTGVVYVELQWGSDSDFKRGDGAQGWTSIPFSMIASAEIASLEELTVEDAQIHVDDENPYGSARWEEDPD